MSENKRFKIYIDYDDWSIIDTTGEYVAEDYIEWMSQKQVCDLLNEQDKQIKELKKENKRLKQEKDSWKNSVCHDMNLKSMLSFEIEKLTETKNIEKFLDFYYKYFCKM